MNQQIQLTMAQLHDEWERLKVMTGCKTKVELMGLIAAGEILDSKGRLVVMPEMLKLEAK